MGYMIREEQSNYQVVAKTHPGMSGKNNEDRFGVTAFRLKENGERSALLAVLCDGIGGHKAGEIAAELAVNLISETIAQSNGKSPQVSLERGIHLANQAIYEAASQDEQKKGMGSTCACVFLRGNQLYAATVGDSRIYLMHGDRIRQISIDHTWIQEALDAGIINLEEVANHPNRHVIRRYLGASQPPVVDFRLRLNKGESDEKAEKNQGLLLQAGDRIFLCSDGLTDLVSDAEILAAFDQRSEEKAVDFLIDLANKRGGHDNITVISAVIPGDVVKPQPKKKSMVPYGCVISAGFVGLVVALLLGYFLWKGFPWEIGNTSPTPPIQTTLNPMITSAPLPTPTLTPPPPPTETLESFFSTPTSTPAAYPAPTNPVLSSPSAYP
ncbi:MAG: hypothetical protein CL609_08405 [Anaerolineaceae bacterium]|nr:hypothetical protein [Anaerolineaceae bacterium]